MNGDRKGEELGRGAISNGEDPERFYKEIAIRINALSSWTNIPARDLLVILLDSF